MENKTQNPAQSTVKAANEGNKKRNKLNTGLKTFWTDFKKFMSKGNVLNLAVAFVMGAAFTKIVNSLVNDLIMPLFAALFGKTDLSNMKWVISETLVISWGSFILTVIEFIVVALFLFLLIRTITKAKDGVTKISKKTLRAIQREKENEDAQTQETAQETAAAPVTPDTTVVDAPVKTDDNIESMESILKDIRALLSERK